MNALFQSRVAYADLNDAVRTPRDTEYMAFARATRAMTDAIANRDTDFARVAQALTLNRRLWSLLAEDLTSAGNQLPDQLRGSLLGLAQFVMNHTEAVLNGTADASPLIDVNTAIMRGLRGQDGAS